MALFEKACQRPPPGGGTSVTQEVAEGRGQCFRLRDVYTRRPQGNRACHASGH